MNRKMKHKTLFTLAVGVLLGISGMTLGQTLNYTFTWEKPVYLRVVSGNIKVYWDSNCTIPVKIINFGDGTRGTIYNVTLYVKNEAPGNSYFMWNSTLHVVTTEYIIDRWYFANFTDLGQAQPLNETTLPPGFVARTLYMIYIGSAALQTYSWTLDIFTI
jgi:hypothetical protein